MLAIAGSQQFDLHAGAFKRYKRNSTPSRYYRVKDILRSRAMKIGNLAKRAGCKVETVRYYESEGLLLLRVVRRLP